MSLEVVVLALMASGFTALASVAQRRAAAPAPETSASAGALSDTSSIDRCGSSE